MRVPMGGECVLVRSDTFLHKLVEASVDAIVSCDMTRRVLLFNRAAEELLGWEREEVVASVRLDRLLPGGVADEILEMIRSDGHGGPGKLGNREMSIQNRAGDEIPVGLSGGMLYNPRGEESALFVMFRDLRPWRALQGRLLQAEKMASLGRMAAGVAHEINNPLTGITLVGNLLRERIGDDPQARADLETVLEQAARCQRTVADLLALSRPPDTEHPAVDLNRIVEGALDAMSMQPQWSGIRVVRDLAPGALWVRGDSDRLRQVFVNLLDNAARMMEGDGQVRVTTRARADNNQVEACVSDTGPGIEPEVRERIFEPFFTTRAGRGGTGLGLSICYAIVKEHAGTIQVDSDPGGGARLILRFPAGNFAGPWEERP